MDVKLVENKNPVVANFIKKCGRDYTFDLSLLLSQKGIPTTNFSHGFYFGVPLL
jgi:hypothetical protein